MYGMKVKDDKTLHSCELKYEIIQEYSPFSLFFSLLFCYVGFVIVDYLIIPVLYF